MNIDWELREAGQPDGESTVLLLPGGMCSAGAYAELMAEPALAATRLIAATLPGHAGTPPPNEVPERIAGTILEAVQARGERVSAP